MINVNSLVRFILLTELDVLLLLNLTFKTILKNMCSCFLESSESI